MFLLPGVELQSQNIPGASNVVIAAGVPLRVNVTRRTKLKRGAPVEGVLLEPVYVGTQLALPKNSRVRGTVSATPRVARSVRVWAMLDGDFTPLHVAVVNFDQVELPSQQTVRFTTVARMRNGAIVRSAPRAKQTLWKQLKVLVGDSLNGVKQQVTGPHKSDRLLRLLYAQLPYHPQRIWADSTFDADLTNLATVQIATPPLALAAAQTINGELPTIKARFAHEVTSKTARPGDPVEAIVTEPVYDQKHLLLLSEGAVAEGVILKAKPARSFGRNGSLRFVFRSVRDKTLRMQAVQGTLSAAESSSNGNLSIDDEGGAHAQPDLHRLLAPLVLAVLATAGADEDGGAAQQGVASNGLGIVARVAGFASGSRNLALAFGSYGVAKSVVRRFIVKGHEVEFPRDTRIEAVLSAK